MVAVSTFRPHKNSEEYARNQIRAVESWQDIFDVVLLIGEAEPELAFPNVWFVPGEDFPLIKDMISLLAREPGWSAWINCDIVLTPMFHQAFQRMKETGKQAATSQRWTFYPEAFDLSKAVIERNDFGLDIFLTIQPHWQHMLSVMPKNLRKAGQVYDTWMTGYFWKRLGRAYCSMTDFRCVFHPRHGGRKMKTHNEPAWIQDQYGRSACIPPALK